MQEHKPRDYTPYGHRKVMTRGRKRYYLALLAYSIPIRLRVLRRVSKTASGADAYAAMAVARYKSLCEAIQKEAKLQVVADGLMRDYIAPDFVCNPTWPDDPAPVPQRAGLDFVLQSGDGSNG